MITQTQAERIAQAINALRPDWPTRSLLTFTQKHLADRAYRDALVALVWVASDPTTKTPARVLEAGPWWRATQAEEQYTTSAVTHHCPEHPSERAWSCRLCAEQAADPGAGITTVRDALRKAPKPPRPASPVRSLDEVRTRKASS